MSEKSEPKKAEEESEERTVSEQQKRYREEDEFFEEEKGVIFEPEHINEQPTAQELKEQERLRKRREWLRSLDQTDRDFIAKYGEEMWRNWKNAGWRKKTGKT
jgi:hypothetical protein